MTKKALITGITGQDGSYLAEFLLSKGYEVHGIIRRASTFNTHRIDHIYVDPHENDSRLLLHYGDLTDPGLMTEIVYNVRPDEVYHLGAQSHVRVSFDMPEFTGNVTGLGTTRLLEAIRRSGVKSRFYQASSSELFGSAPAPQSEATPFHPQSPYAIAKLYSYWMVADYRKAYDMFACNGILFNHESPRRGENFVSRKVTRGVANILAGKQKKLYMGYLNAKRDWGFAPEYVEMMWLMLQQEMPDDYVVGTGESHTVRELIEKAFSYVDVELEWTGDGVLEKGIASSVGERSYGQISTGDTLVEIDPRYFRPTEVEYLRAKTDKASKKLGWSSRVEFDEMLRIMVDYDMLALGIEPPREGMRTVLGKGIDWTRHEFSLHERIRETIG